MANNNSNQLLVPGVEQALEQMKYEIASEFGVNLGAETTSRANGSVGGEITKRLVQTAQQQLSADFLNNNNINNMMATRSGILSRSFFVYFLIE